MGIKDVILDAFKLSNKSAHTKYSTLDHGVVESTGNFKQNDGYNCGGFNLPMMIICCKGEIEYLQHAYTEDDLKKFRIRLFNHIFIYFELVAPNRFLL